MSAKSSSKYAFESTSLVDLSDQAGMWAGVELDQPLLPGERGLDESSMFLVNVQSTDLLSVYRWKE